MHACINALMQTDVEPALRGDRQLGDRPPTLFLLNSNGHFDQHYSIISSYDPIATLYTNHNYLNYQHFKKSNGSKQSIPTLLNNHNLTYQHFKESNGSKQSIPTLLNKNITI